MRVNIPASIKTYAPKVTAQLVAGTYSMAAPDVFPLSDRQLADNRMLFRAVGAPANAPDDLLRLGSLNPASIIAGNRTVLLVIETAGTGGGGDFIIAAWVPDGGAGRYVVEHERFFIKSWFGNAIARFKLTLRLGPTGAQDLLQRWVANLMRDGAFQDAYDHAFDRDILPMRSLMSEKSLL